MIKSGLVLADRHHVAGEDFHPSYLVVKRFAKSFMPDFVVDLGDTLDLPYFASFNENDVEILADGCWEDDVDLLNWELDFWQGLVGKKYFWYMGNHDWRVKVVAGKQPRFKQSLDYRKRFHVGPRGITLHSYEDGPIKMGKVSFVHGWFTNKYHAAKTVVEYGGNVIYGHVHKNQTYPHTHMDDGKEIEANSIGCLCGKNPSWLRGKPSHWQNSFGIIYIDTTTGLFNFYRPNIIKGEFIWNGKKWKA